MMLTEARGTWKGFGPVLSCLPCFLCQIISEDLWPDPLLFYPRDTGERGGA